MCGLVSKLFARMFSWQPRISPAIFFRLLTSGFEQCVCGAQVVVQLMISTSSISSSASVGGDSYSSLNHSYETLNMSDTGGDVATASTPLATGHQQTLPRLPHRPAPPIPSLLPKMLMTAKEREYLQQVGYNLGLLKKRWW